MRGEHSYRITDDGIVIFPRTETFLVPPAADNVAGPPLTTGLPQLDRMMGGGFPHCSTALLIGPPGIGKTTFGLHFLSECDEQNRGLLFGVYETPAAILDKARVLGLPLERLIAQGHVDVVWQSTTHGLLDQVCHKLVQLVRLRGIRRLFIDGLQGFMKLATERGRLEQIFEGFSNEFRGLGVSTVYTSEADLVGPVGGLPFSGFSLQGVSCIAEIILVMRYVELRSQLHRMISVLKVRDAEINSALHKFTITQSGLVIDGDPSRAEAILAQAAGQGGDPAPNSAAGIRHGGEE
jgi:circadian clock protein KaiC